MGAARIRFNKIGPITPAMRKAVGPHMSRSTSTYRRKGYLLTVMAGVSVCMTLAPCDASAQQIGQKTEVALSVGILSFAKSSVSFAVPGIAEQEFTGTAFGTLDSATIGIGYAINDAVVLGADVEASYETQSTDGEDDASESSVVLAPKIHYYLPGDATRMFLGASVGLALGSVDDGEAEMTTTGVALTATLGIAWFATESVSLKPSLSAGYIFGSTELEGGGLSAEADASGFGITLDLALSAWL